MKGEKGFAYAAKDRKDRIVPSTSKYGQCFRYFSGLSHSDSFRERLGFNLLRPALARLLDLDGAFQEGFRLQEDSISLPQDLRYGRFKLLKTSYCAIQSHFENLWKQLREGEAE